VQAFGVDWTGATPIANVELIAPVCQALAGVDHLVFVQVARSAFLAWDALNSGGDGYAPAPAEVVACQSLCMHVKKTNKKNNTPSRSLTQKKIITASAETPLSELALSPKGILHGVDDSH